MINKIKPNIWQFTFNKFGSHVYLIKLKEKNILIDTSSPENKSQLKNYLEELGIPNIHIVILTHKHWDHIGNPDLFPNAKIYASKLDFPEEKIINIHELKIPEFQIIETPGHSKGSFCILYEEILFSGDTIFHHGTIGRTDLPGSSEIEMKNSLSKIKKLNYKILCPGHGQFSE